MSITDLLSASGPLLAVTGIEAAPGRFSVIYLTFAAGTLNLRCDDETDEILIAVESTGEHPAIDAPGLEGLLGTEIEDAWSMSNQRGFRDAFQLRLVGGGREETRQFEVAASAIDVRVVS